MTAGGRFRGSRPTIPLIARRTPAASAPNVVSCLTESWPTDNDDLSSQDLSWDIDKFAQAFPSDGTSAIFFYSSFTHGAYGGGLHVVGNRLSLAKPTVAPSSADSAYDTPYWGYTDGDAILAQDLPADVTLTYTLAEVPATADAPSATPVCRSWGASPYLRLDPDTFDGWEVFLSNFGDISDTFPSTATVLWDGGAKFFDPQDPYDDPPGIAPFASGDVITFTVTGTGADTRVVVTRNGDTLVDLFGAALSTANGGDFSGLPTGNRADLFLYMQGQQLTDEAGPGNSPHYPFFGPISDDMDDTLAVDDVSFCPA